MLYLAIHKLLNFNYVSQKPGLLYLLLCREHASLVMYIVRPLADDSLTSFLVANVHRFSRPEAYQIVATSEDARASRNYLNF